MKVAELAAIWNNELTSIPMLTSTDSRTHFNHSPQSILMITVPVNHCSSVIRLLRLFGHSFFSRLTPATVSGGVGGVVRGVPQSAPYPLQSAQCLPWQLVLFLGNLWCACPL